MAPPQAVATFPGLENIRAADMTFSTGITPSACTIRTVPQRRFVAEVGELQLRFQNTVIRFPDAAVNLASLRIDQSGQIISLNIVDRRWKWQFGEVNGRFNVRKSDNVIDNRTKKTPQELATILLDAMGERRYDVSRLPNETFPEFLWEAANPAQELARLCDHFSCRVVLGLDNRVRLWPIGKGRDLPANGKEMNVGFGVESKLKPDEIKVVGGPTLVQAKLELEAVGLETDGRVRLIDDLSYKPAVGWEAEDPRFFTGVTGTFKRDKKDVEHRELALQSVFRWYRMKGHAVTGLKVPGAVRKLNDVDQLLPINDHLIETEVDPSGVRKPKPAFITGVFDTKVGIRENSLANSLYNGDFTIDRERGIVMLSEYAIKHFTALLAKVHKPAELYLTTSFNVALDPDEPKQREERFRKRGRRNNTGPLILHHPEIVFTVIAEYDGLTLKRTRDNRKDFDAEADHYLDAAERNFTREPSSEVEYAGIVAIEPDGAIQQVSWKIGNGPALTRASRNEEYNVFTPSFKERRRREVADAIARAFEAAGGVFKAARNLFGV